MDCGLNGRTGMISGGSAGNGRATAELYGGEPGVQVAIPCLYDREGASEVEQRLAPIDVLINNAVQWPAERLAFEDGPIAYRESFFAVNLFGTVRLCLCVAPSMKRRGWGRIVLLSSDLAVDSMMGSGRYSSLEAALFGRAANLVVELSPYGVLTDPVLPSWTLTERARAHLPSTLREAAVAAFPTGRMTEPADGASLVPCLESAANGQVSGEHISVTGGSSQPLMGYLWARARSAAGAESAAQLGAGTGRVAAEGRP